MYSFLLRLNLKHRDSNSCLYRSNLAFTPSVISSAKTLSLANNKHQGTSSYIDRVISYLGPLQKEKGLGTNLNEDQ